MFSTNTEAPSRAKSNAAAFPIPCAAPVISATLFSSRAVMRVHSKIKVFYCRSDRPLRYIQHHAGFFARDDERRRQNQQVSVVAENHAVPPAPFAYPRPNAELFVNVQHEAPQQTNAARF